jgi:hypothetical protein
MVVGMSDHAGHTYTIDDLKHARYRVLQAWRDLQAWREIYRITVGDGIPLPHVASATGEQRREFDAALSDLAQIAKHVHG